MSGERSLYFIEVAERAAGRIAERLAMVADRYSPPSSATDQIVTLDELMQHYTEYAHIAPDENCAHPICERTRRVLARELAAMAQPQQPQQQARGGR